MRHIPISFASPSWLWLLLGVLGLVLLDVLRRWGTFGAPTIRTDAAGTGAGKLAAPSVRRSWLGILVRAAALAALVVALADPRWRKRDDVAWVVFVVDRSASIPDKALEDAFYRVEEMRSGFAKNVKVGLVLADAEPTIAVFPGEPWNASEIARGERPEATDLSASLDVALGLVPGGDTGAVVLLSDGRPTAGERSAFVLAAKARGVGSESVPIHVVTMSPERQDPAVTAVVLDEAHVRPGASTSGRVEVDGGATPFKGKMVLRIGDKIVATQDVALEPGQSIEIPFEHSLELGTAEGPLTVDAELIPDSVHSGEAAAPIGQGSATVVVGTKPRILLLAGETRDSDLLAAALRAEEMQVEVRTLDSAAGFPKEVPPETDLVVLANAPASTMAGEKGLSTELLEALARWIDSGGGMVVLGGPRAFDMGGYAATPIERILPVRLDPVDPLIEPAATIIIVLDKSGSMGMEVAGKTKMELADEGVVASLRMLRAFDYVGVMSVTEDVTWDVTVQPVTDAVDMERRVMRIRAGGGGIYVYTGLEAAKDALADARTPLRHVVLFSDCADSEEQVKGIGYGGGPGPTALELARGMKADGITTTVIGIGNEDDQDTQFLKDLARDGGGKFYLTNDATKLKAMFVQETERLVDTSVQEVEFQPEVLEEHPMVRGLDYTSSPMLTGYQRLEPRATAEVLLAGPAGDPLLVTWRYGLGQVVAWASDAGPRWSARWIAWEGYTKHWTQVARFSLRSRAGDETAVEVDTSGKQPVARVARRDTGGMSIEGQVRARVRSGKGKPQELSLSAKEPGLYEASLDGLPASGVHVLEVVDGTGKLLREHRFVLPPPEEHRYRTPDIAWLETLAARTSGRTIPFVSDGSVLQAPAAKPSTTSDQARLWPWLAMLAALLLPIDAMLRRGSRAI